MGTALENFKKIKNKVYEKPTSSRAKFKSIKNRPEDEASHIRMVKGSEGKAYYKNKRTGAPYKVRKAVDSEGLMAELSKVDPKKTKTETYKATKAEKERWAKAKMKPNAKSKAMEAYRKAQAKKEAELYAKKKAKYGYIKNGKKVDPTQDEIGVFGKTYSKKKGGRSPQSNVERATPSKEPTLRDRRLDDLRGLPQDKMPWRPHEGDRNKMPKWKRRKKSKRATEDQWDKATPAGPIDRRYKPKRRYL
jgi:hypothetical protein